MKTLVYSVLALIFIIIVIFVFASKETSDNDTFQPSPIAFDTQQDENSLKESESESMNLPFKVMEKEELEGLKVTVESEKGKIVIDIFSDSPIAASNFIALIEQGFYDGLSFHRREEGFVIQGGDPNGNGTGGPGYNFPDEPVTKDYNRGIVAMANAGPNTNGSQFFIMLADAPQLPKNYTIFGQVSGGIDIIDKIQVGDKMLKLTLE